MKLVINTVRTFPAEKRTNLCRALQVVHRRFNNPKLVEVFARLENGENVVRLHDEEDDMVVDTVYEILNDA